MDVSKQEKFLVLMAQNGDRNALNKLLQIVQQSLFRYVCRLTGDAGLAEDILQEVFLIVCRKLRWLENPSLFRAWTYRIASREAFRYLKKERRWSEQIREDEFLEKIPAEFLETVYEPELIEKLRELLPEVSAASRAVLILHYLEELPLSETAEILDINIGTAKSRLAYGLETLRKKMK